ncbi:hypothetical protein N8072_00870 [bacterium]|nr:hypothetical protein [bacterium]MDB4128753.1 hypothetical protein [bacterium]MDC1257212.1 hypothetical protein [bacterium]
MDKYTASEWALIEGGHTLPEDDKGLKFFQELGEARMFKTRDQVSKSGANTLTNHMFANLLSLYIMSNDYNYAPVAKKYATKTASMGGFGRPSPGGTDLYQTIHSLEHPEYFKGDAKASMHMGKVNVDQVKVKRFLNGIKTGNLTPQQASSFFMKLERDLKITDPKLRATRRLGQDWSTLNSQQRQLVGNHLSRYYRSDAMRSDMAPLFNNFAKDNKLVLTPSKTAKIAKSIARKAGSFAAGYMIGKNLDV